MQGHFGSGGIIQRFTYFRITGGNLMSKDTWKVLDYIIQEKIQIKTYLLINSNLGMADKLVDRFIEKINRITEEDKVRVYYIYFSRFWEIKQRVYQKWFSV